MRCFRLWWKVIGEAKGVVETLIAIFFGWMVFMMISPNGKWK